MNINLVRPIMPHLTTPKPGALAEFLAGFIFVAVIAFVSFLLGRYVSRKFKTDKKKSILIFIAVSVIVGIGLFCFFGLSAEAIKGIIFCHILLTASISDLNTRECDDWLSVMILIASFIGTDVKTIPLRLLSGVVILILILIPALLTKGHMIGGADIKIATCSAVMLGLTKSIIALIAGLAISIIVNFIKLKDTDKGFPLLPYFALTFIPAFFI